jgi:GNAT superfamily N-acetyltransferase
MHGWADGVPELRPPQAIDQPLASGSFRNTGPPERRFPAPPMISGLLVSQIGWSDTGERINRGRGEFDRADWLVREYLEGALMLAAERWQTYTADPERTYRALTAPGATTRVAIDKGVVAGLVQLQSDGEIQAHLSALITGAQWRRRGLGRALVREALARAGGLRIDLLSRSGSYYLSLGAESVPGFRLHKETMA